MQKLIIKSLMTSVAVLAITMPLEYLHSASANDQNDTSQGVPAVKQKPALKPKPQGYGGKKIGTAQPEVSPQEVAPSNSMEISSPIKDGYKPTKGARPAKGYLPTEIKQTAAVKFASKEALLNDVNDAINNCAALIKGVDGQTQSFWNYTASKVSTKKKKAAIDSLNKSMSYKDYLDNINDLKVKNNTKKAEFTKLIKEWDLPAEWKPADADKWNAMTVQVSKELKSYATNCANPVNTIKKQIDDRKAAQKKW